MRLPHRSHAKIAESKITKYLLSTEHEDGRHKAAFFIQFGFSASAWQNLADALLRHVHEHEVANILKTERGEHYTVEGELETPSGRRPLVRTIWMLEYGSTQPRLITAYPLRRSR